MLLASFFCTNAFALSCRRPGIEEKVKSADDIFIGEVDEIISSVKIDKHVLWEPRHRSEAYLKISKIIRGEKGLRQKVVFSFNAL